MRLGNPETVSPFVAEIRDRLAEIAAREAALRQREREITDRAQRAARAATEAAERELEAARERLTHRSTELDAQAIELSARTARLDQLDQQLRDREEALAQGRVELQAETESLDETRRRQHDQVESARRNLRRRIETIRHHEAELTRRVQLAHDEVAAQRRVAAELRDRAARETAELEQRKQELAGNQTLWERRFGALQTRAAEVEGKHTELLARRTEFDAQQQDLHRRTSELEQARQRVAGAERKLESARKRDHERRQTFAREAESLASRRRTLEIEGTAQAQRASQLDRRAQELQAQDESLVCERERIAALERDLQEREGQIDDLRGQAERIEAEARRRRDDAEVLREQIESRDAESRQSALALEVEQQQLEHERTALELAYDELSELRSQREQEFRRVREVLGERSEQLARAERSALTAPKLWWLRAGSLATAAAIVAAAFSYAWDTPRYRGSAELAITTMGDPVRVSAEHATAIAAPGWADDAIGDERLRHAWTEAIRAARVRAEPTAEAAGLTLHVLVNDPTMAGQLADAVAQGYRDRVNAVPAGFAEPRAYRDLTRRRDAAGAELSRLRWRANELGGELLASAEPAGREPLLAAVRARNAEHETLVAQLDRTRAELEDLASREAPGGQIDPEALRTRLAADPAVQQDQQELALTFRAYRDELAVALAPTVQPLEALRTSVDELGAFLVEQRELARGPEVSLVLEECSGVLEQLAGRLTEFETSRESGRRTVATLTDDTETVQLVGQQGAAVARARRLANEISAARDALDRKADALVDATGGQTRGMVIATELRSRITRLGGAMQRLVDASQQVELRENFRLDARDRKLRGVRTRLTRKRETLRQQMQGEADEAARERHEQRIRTLGNEVRELEQRRDFLVAALVEENERLRALEEELFERRRVEAEQTVCASEIARLETQLADIEAQIADAQRNGSAPDRMRLTSLRSEQVGGVHRVRNASLAAGGAFACIGLVCLSMILKSPLRRRRRDAGGGRGVRRYSLLTARSI